MHEGPISKMFCIITNQKKKKNTTQSSPTSVYTTAMFLILLLAPQRFCFVFKPKNKQTTKNKNILTFYKLYNLHGMMCFDLSSAVAPPVAIRT